MSSTNMDPDPQTLTSLLSLLTPHLHPLSPSSPSPSSPSVLPSLSALATARTSLHTTLPLHGHGTLPTATHLLTHLTPGLNASSLSPNYYGFVTGGCLPVAGFADFLVTAWDQNVGVHLPMESVVGNVEDAALRMVVQALRLGGEGEEGQEGEREGKGKEEGEGERVWKWRVCTTGATGSNVLGVAGGREWVLREMGRRQGKTRGEEGGQGVSIGELGLVEAMRRVGCQEVQVLTTIPHSSLVKAAAVLGLGRKSVKSVGKEEDPLRFDMQKLEEMLSKPATASIVAVSCAEVNTGFFATDGDDMKRIRELCNTHGAWLHVDGAFGLPARLLTTTTPAYSRLIAGVSGISLADSLAGDAHKFFNVPYDCGFFLSKHLDIATDVFRNPNAAYLAAGAEDGIAQPLNVGLENSRRWRALPLYAGLVAHGREGYREMLERQIGLARRVAGWVWESERYALLPAAKGRSKEEVIAEIYIIVLFRAKDEVLNQQLVSRIKETRKIYVSGTAWEGKPACRIAVSNWRVEIERDSRLIFDVLEEVAN